MWGGEGGGVRGTWISSRKSAWGGLCGTCRDGRGWEISVSREQLEKMGDANLGVWEKVGGENLGFREEERVGPSLGNVWKCKHLGGGHLWRTSGEGGNPGIWGGPGLVNTWRSSAQQWAMDSS